VDPLDRGGRGDARDVVSLLEYVGDAGARELEAEVDPEGPDHNERSGDPQHPPRRHLIHQIRDLEHLAHKEDSDR